MRVMRSDRRKCRSGQPRGLYFVVKSGDDVPRDNEGTLCSNVQADARDPSSWRRGRPDERRELPTAAPQLSSGSPPRRPHTPDTPPPRTHRCATARDHHSRRAIGGRADAATSPTHPPARACWCPRRGRRGFRPPPRHLHGPRHPTPRPAGGRTARRARYGVVRGGAAPPHAEAAAALTAAPPTEELFHS